MTSPLRLLLAVTATALGLLLAAWLGVWTFTALWAGDGEGALLLPLTAAALALGPAVTSVLYGSNGWAWAATGLFTVGTVGGGLALAATLGA